MVTGAARGIGAAIAAALAGDGAAVAIGDLEAAQAAATAKRFGRRALGLQLDVTDSDSVAAALDRVEAELGPVDVLVNNAGVDVIAAFLDTEEADWRKVIEVNLLGTIRCTQAVARRMAERGRGTVISVASDAGKVGSSGEAVYSATKGGLIAFTKTLARELAHTGVTANCVCPGPTDTALLAQLAESNPRLRESLARAIPLRRIAQPDDIAGVVAFLASPRAAYMTGQAISVSGGLTMS